MLRFRTVVVDIGTVRARFREVGAWECIKSGRWTSIVLAHKEAPSHAYPSCVSQILKHFDASGRHVATTHRIVDRASGHIHHWDEKDIVVGCVKYVRV